MSNFRTYYDKTRGKVFSTSIKTPSLTEQCFKNECDINEIVRRPNMGINPFNRPNITYQYGDFSELHSFQDAQNIVARAKSQFESLPALLRQRFNTPDKFLEFANNPKNFDECVKLGIYEQHIENTDIKVEKPAEVPEQVVSQPVQSTNAEPSAQ